MGREWQKIVYGGMQDGYPDNFTHSSFLEGLVMNAHLVQRDLWTTVLDSVIITQYLSIVASIASVWIHTLNLRLDAGTLLALDVFFLALGFFTWLVTNPSSSWSSFVRLALNLCYFVCGLYIMTPIFHTLTRSISSDSISACTVGLLLVHLFFHDFTGKTSTNSVLANISLHASVVASVLIASRLPSRPLVFATMLFSLEFFLLFPFVSCSVKNRSMKLHVGVSVLLVMVALCLVYSLSFLAFAVLAVFLVFITFVCPLWLLKIQKYKFEINGPWDEAKLCFDIDER